MFYARLTVFKIDINIEWPIFRTKKVSIANGL